MIVKALHQAQLKSNEIDYVEAHGTGTSLGDPIEIRAMSQVLGNRDQPLLISSVKTYIGHLEAAAGMASVIKVLLALQKQEIPQNLHFNKLNDNIKIPAGLDLVIPTTNYAWPSGGIPRVAGVSGFALREYPP